MNGFEKYQLKRFVLLSSHVDFFNISTTFYIYIFSIMFEILNLHGPDPNLNLNFETVH
jgi:hypothetical protein